MTSDRVKGAAKDAMGTAKEKVGEATGDERLQDEGAADKLEGKGQGVVGKAKEAVGDLKKKVS
jgi:uncharacterized protein YjbJ (UPF0337 family)